MNRFNLHGLVSCVVVFVLITIPVMAREHAVKFGIKTGLNISSLDNIRPLGDTPDDPGLGSWIRHDRVRTGFSGGVFIHYHRPGTRFGFQADLLYSQQGNQTIYADQPPQTIEDGIYFGGGARKYNVNYLNLPIVLKFYPVGGLHLMVGLQPGLLLNAKSKTPSASLVVPKPYVKDIADKFRSFDLGLPVGIGYDFSWGLQLEARYSFGMIDSRIRRNGSRNNVVQISVGWRCGTDRSRSEQKSARAGR